MTFFLSLGGEALSPLMRDMACGTHIALDARPANHA